MEPYKGLQDLLEQTTQLKKDDINKIILIVKNINNDIKLAIKCLERDLLLNNLEFYIKIKYILEYELYFLIISKNLTLEREFYQGKDNVINNIKNILIAMDSKLNIFLIQKGEFIKIEELCVLTTNIRIVEEISNFCERLMEKMFNKELSDFVIGRKLEKEETYIKMVKYLPFFRYTC